MNEDDDIMSCATGMTVGVAGHIVTSECGLENNRYHGTGTIKFCNENMYEGSLVNGKLHGTGTFTWGDTIQYRGAFLDNVIDGIGSYTWPDGGQYNGEIMDGKRHGKGVFTKGSIIYQGEWKQGLKSGLGILYYNSTSTHYYKGEFKDGMKNGWGIMTFESGSTYEGEWKTDKMTGYGVMQWLIPGPPASAGTVLYSKDRVLLETHANESFDVADSDDVQVVNTSLPFLSGLATAGSDAQTGRVETYEGQWKESKPNGYGIYSWLCKARPRTHLPRSAGVGTSLLGMETPLHGENTYKGWFTEGKRNGKGVLTLADGVVFEGTWVNNVKQGSGVLVHPCGKVEVLTLLDNVIQAKRVLKAGLCTVEPGTVKYCTETQGLTINEQEYGEAIGLGIDESLDCNEADKQVEYKEVKDLLTRNLPQLKFLYKFYATVGTSIPLKTPSDMRKSDRKRIRYEKMIQKKARASMVSAKEAAFCYEPEFIKRKLVKPPQGHMHKPRREVLLAQLHDATHLIAADAIEMSKKVALNSRPNTAGTVHEITPGPSPDPGVYSAIVSPVVITEEPSTMLRLHQLWSIFKESGITDAGLPLWKCNRVLAKTLAKQPQCRDDLTCLSSDEEGSDSSETLSQRTSRQKGKRRSETSTTRSRRQSMASRSPQTTTLTVSPDSSKVPSSNIYRKGFIAKVKRQQEDDPDDPQTTVVFPVFVQCLIRIAHVKAKYTVAHTYNNASKNLSLRDRVLWLLSMYIQPLVDALSIASESPAGPLLGLPTLVQPVPANITHKITTEVKKIKKPRPSSAVLSIPVPSKTEKEGKGKEDNQEIDTPRSTQVDVDCETRKRKKSDIPHVSVNDKTQKCGGESITLTTTTVTSPWSDTPNGTIYTETRDGYSSVCLGLQNAVAYNREREWDARHREAWNAYQDAKDVIEEWNQQQQEASSRSEDPVITLEQCNQAKGMLNTLELPNRLTADLDVGVLLRAAPVLDKVAAGSDLLIRLYTKYSKSSKGNMFSVQSLARLMRDYSLVGTVSNKQTLDMKIKRLACKLVKEKNEQVALQMEAELNDMDAVVQQHGEEENNCCSTQPVMKLLRPCLWYVMNVNLDLIAARRSDVKEASVPPAAAVPAVPVCQTRQATLRSIRSVNDFSCGDFEETMVPKEALSPEIKTLLVQRDEIKADVTWFPPPSPSVPIRPLPHEVIFANIPILYHEYVHILVLLGCIIFDKQNANHPNKHPLHIKLGQSMHASFSLLLKKLSGTPRCESTMCVPDIPLCPPVLLPQKASGGLSTQQKAKKK